MRLITLLWMAAPLRLSSPSRPRSVVRMETEVNFAVPSNTALDSRFSFRAPPFFSFKKQQAVVSNRPKKKNRGRSRKADFASTYLHLPSLHLFFSLHAASSNRLPLASNQFIQCFVAKEVTKPNYEFCTTIRQSTNYSHRHGEASQRFPAAIINNSI